MHAWVQSIQGLSMYLNPFLIIYTCLPFGWNGIVIKLIAGGTALYSSVKTIFNWKTAPEGTVCVTGYTSTAPYYFPMTTFPYSVLWALQSGIPFVQIITGHWSC